VPTLLFEIGCEELPSRAVYEAGEQLPVLVRDHLDSEADEVFLGPRRLAMLVRDLPEETPARWIQGPPLTVGEKAAEGFARKLGVGRDALEERNGVLGWLKPPESIASTLPDRLDAILRGLTFAKTMVWDGTGPRFARPVRWTFAILDDEIVVGTTSFGHRFTAGAVEIPHAEAYADTLRAQGVEPVLERRRASIVEGLDRLGAWSDPMGKLDEVVNLVESPVVLEGAFAERFLELPPRVVETAMQSHQRYFPLGGNGFGFVANGGDPAVVRVGNERVLEGRLEDASFTFRRDVATGIEALAQQLGAITFFRGAGTYADKTARLVQLVRELGGDEDAVEAARLAKADQASELVREFPDLEGHVGAVYARLAGKLDAVVVAIEDQYLPDASGGPLPSTSGGSVLAAADKLDTLTVAFGLGHRPTGSRDPYALRRAAIGLCRLAIEGGLPVRITDPEVREFVEERLEGLLELPVEFVRAARGAHCEELGKVAELARFLHAMSADRLATVHEVYTRASRIVGDAPPLVGAYDAELATDEAERALAATVAGAPGGDAEAIVAWACEASPVVARFFEDVLVMDPDETVRENRLRLLKNLRDAVGRLGDLSQIPL
jgi:glycyl-tRNA synthetase beta chain